MPRPLRILMLTEAFAPDRGGVERHIGEVSRELAAMGHAVTVLTGGLERGLAAVETVDGVTRVRLRAARSGPALLRRPVEWLRMAVEAGRVREADLVHVHDFRAFLRWYLPLRFLLPGTPVFVTFHGYEGWPLPGRVIRLRRLVRRLCAGAIGVGGFIERHYGTPLDRIVVGGVRRVEGTAGDRDDRRGALFLGRLAPDLSADLYLEALSELARVHGKALTLDVAGDGPLRGALEARAAQLGLEARFHGWVDDPFPRLLRARVAFVDSYLAILESMACGTPVFSIYGNPLKRDYLESIPRVSGFMTVRGSAAGLAGELAAWIDEPGPVAARAARARAAVRELTWASVARTYLDLYGEKGV